MPPRGKILITSDFILDPWLVQVEAELKGRGYEVLMGPTQKPPVKTLFDRSDWDHYFGSTDVVVTSSRTLYPRELLEYAKNLRAIIYCTTGTESIDLDDARDLGLIIGHGPSSENIDSMSEATVLMILAIMYNLPKTQQILAQDLPRPTIMNARLLRGKTIGLIGLGRIARGVASRMAGWGVEFLAVTRDGGSAGAPENVEVVPLPDLLRRSDVVCMLTTLTPETANMLRAEHFAMMKPGSVFVNTARGGMVDETALYDALKSGHLAGAALDAFQLEPLPKDHPFRTLDNVILTPHLVGHTREVYDVIPALAVANVDRVMTDEMPVYCRNPDVEPAWRSRLASIGPIH